MQSLISYLASDGSYFMLTLMLQSTLLASLVLLAASVLKHHAAARYAILFPAMIAMLALPLGATLFQRSGASLVLVPLPGEVRETDRSNFSSLVSARALTGSFDTAADTSGPLSASAPGVGFEPPRRPDRFNINRLLLRLWLGVAAIAMLKLLLNLFRLQRITTVGRSITPDEAELVADSMRPYRGDWEPEKAGLILRVSPAVDSPMLGGLLRPVLLLPEPFLQSLEQSHLGAVLLHELAHLERGDVLFNILQKAILALYWFHPLIHLMDRQLDRAREEICDNHVLNHQQAVDYGEALLKLGLVIKSKSDKQGIMAGFKQAESDLAMGMFDPEWKLEQRIKDLLSHKREKSMQISNLTKQVIRAGIISCSIGLACLQVSAAQLPENSTEPSGTLQSEPSLDRTQGSGASGRAPVFESQQLKEEIRRSLQQAIKEVDRELDSNRVQAEIDTAMVALRAQLAELRARGTGDGILDTDQFSAIHKAALESALRNLEEMDIEKMTSDIRSNLYQSLERLNDSDFGFDSNLEPDSDDIDSAGISIDGPA